MNAISNSMVHSQKANKAEFEVAEIRQPDIQTGKTSLFSRRLPKRELVNITSQLAIMTRSGVDIATALDSLQRQSKNQVAQQILGEIYEDVLAGKSFSAALAEHGRAFGPSYVASVTAGEASGRMWEVLAQLAKLNRNEFKMQNRIRTVAAYPLILTVVSLAVSAALMLFVLPQFADIFADAGTPLPWITEAMIGISDELRSRAWIWGPLMLFLLVGLSLFFTSPGGKELMDRWLLEIPIVKEVNQFLITGRSCQLLGLLLESGVPLVESLGLVRNSVHNSRYRSMYTHLEESVLTGSGLGNILLENDFFPPSAAEMMMTAEKTGTLGSATRLIGEHFEEEGEEQLKTMMAIAEPAITVLMGGFVALVVLSVSLPMFDLANMAR